MAFSRYAGSSTKSQPFDNDIVALYTVVTTSPMNMFKPTSATTIQDYLASLPPERRAEMERIDAFIRSTVPSLTPHFARNMIGYGTFPYLNYKKEQITWPVIALASQKQYISIYVCAIDNGVYVAEKHKNDLGNVTVGKSCISFKKTDDLHLDALKKVLKAAEKKPGLVSTAKKK